MFAEAAAKKLIAKYSQIKAIIKLVGNLYFVYFLFLYDFPVNSRKLFKISSPEIKFQFDLSPGFYSPFSLTQRSGMFLLELGRFHITPLSHPGQPCNQTKTNIMET